MAKKNMKRTTTHQENRNNREWKEGETQPRRYETSSKEEEKNDTAMYREFLRELQET